MQNETIIGAEYPEKVGKLIDTAIFSIDILMFDWRWYKNDPSHPLQIFNQKLVRAVRRGVKVRCITNYAELVETLNLLGFDAKVWPQSTLLHSKLLIFDKLVIVSGSHNLTGNAFCSNVEISTIINEPALAKSFGDYFENIW
jgi:phosphatidylserine/phosphatidylglycerophosphate/cardiolipin synthase-like enzyme